MNRVLITIAIMVMCISLSAEVPHLISYQGILKDSTGEVVEDNVHALKFSIYNDSTEGLLLWESEGFVPLQITNGLFQHVLGSTNPIPDSISNFSNLWLGVAIGLEPELPRTQIVSVPFAISAQYADTCDYAINYGGSSISKWTPNDSVLSTNNNWGIAKGNASNMFYGDSAFTMINFGISCTTGTNGNNYRYSTISGGIRNIASQEGSTVGGGVNNSAIGGAYGTVSGGIENVAESYSAVGGGFHNIANSSQSTIGGGWENTASGTASTIGGGNLNSVNGYMSTIGGGHQNMNEGDYSVVSGGFADTINTGSDYSYLFGIGSKLTEDSTFMVDMPHVRFGDETTGYEFPSEDGSNGQMMATDGNGNINWTDQSTGLIPIGAVTSWLKNFPNVPPLSDNFVECNGQVLDDSSSIFNGQTIPNLNGENRFLRGNSASGGIGGSENHQHTTNIPGTGAGSTGGQITVGSSGSFASSDASNLPFYYEVVWIIRIK